MKELIKQITPPLVLNMANKYNQNTETILSFQEYFLSKQKII